MTWSMAEAWLARGWATEVDRDPDMLQISTARGCVFTVWRSDVCTSCDGDTRSRNLVIVERPDGLAASCVPGRRGAKGSCYTCEGTGYVRLRPDGTQIREGDRRTSDAGPL